MNIKSNNIIQTRKEEVCSNEQCQKSNYRDQKMIDSPSPNSSESEKTNKKILNWFNYKNPTVNNNLFYH